LWSDVTAYAAQALEELEQIVRFIRQDDSQSAISNQKSDIKHQTSAIKHHMVALSGAISQTSRAT
jgi:hypothetical protein